MKTKASSHTSKHKKTHKQSGLLWAFVHMLEHMKDSLETIEEKSLSVFEEAIRAAKRSARRHEKVHPNEIEQAAQLIKKDLHDLGSYVAATGNALGDWLGLDWNLVEEKIFELLLSVADQSLIEREHYSPPGDEHEFYFAGDIISAGTLQCIRCNHCERYYKASTIKSCEECNSKNFRRFHHGRGRGKHPLH